jgi:hypothetical protein
MPQITMPRAARTKGGLADWSGSSRWRLDWTMSLKSQKPSHKTSDLLVKVLEMSMQPLDIVSLEASDHKPSYLRASQKTSDLWS